MEQHEQEAASRRFGTYLRRVREGRRLSLDAVEELSVGFLERVTKSHLSRIENGQAVPSFPRLFTLSRIYGLPVSSLAERFEIELQREMIPAEVYGQSDDELLAEADRFRLSGRLTEALLLYIALRERKEDVQQDEQKIRDTLHLILSQIDCLISLSRYELARDECERVLGHSGATAEQRLIALQYFVICCYRLGRFTVAMMGLDQAETEMALVEPPRRMKADLAVVRANIHMTTGRPADAIPRYIAALEAYEQIPIPFEVCWARLNLSSAFMEVGDSREAISQIEEALTLAEASGYDRQKALGLSNLAVLAYRKGDLAAAEAYALRSNAVARPSDYLSVIFRNCYYLWKVAQSRGDEPAVKSNERTLRTYVTRVDESLPEAQAFRKLLEGGGK